jgi:acyl-CoA synthetase (AMP-forming)/AMP-acid ligase II
MNIVTPFVRQAIVQPDRTALEVDARTVTYGELLQTVKLLAVRAVAAGVCRGDTVAVVAGPAGHVAATLALAWIGAVSVEVLGDRERVEKLASRLRVNFLFYSGPGGYELDHEGFKGTVALESEAPAGLPLPAIVAVDPGEAWRIALSSGTTGHSKGILYSHERSLVNVNLLRTVYPIAAGDRVFIGMSVTMAFATHNWLRCLTVGACAVMAESPTLEGVLQLFHEGRIAHALVVPGTAGGIAQLAAGKVGCHGKPPAGLRALSIGGARVPVQVQDLLRRHVCPNVFIHYGTTETHLVAVLDAATRERHPRSSGRLLPWVEAEAVDEDDQPLPAGTTGRLRLRSPALALGYVGATEAADLQAFRDGWFYSSDLGKVSLGGVVTVQGRANDVLNLGGAKIDPVALEDAIQEDPAIIECAVVDVPDALGQPVLAVLVVASAQEIDFDGMRRRCGKLSLNCVPRLIFRVETLPRNESGKIVRAAVRRAVRASLEAEALRA